ncbi:MAG: sensor histidine kinase [Methylocystaceae bacterium]|nr:MAG: sensor histidine kinase [Methylocystaceae bacterium]
MKRNQALSSRLVAYWVAGSVLAFFTLPATVYLPLTALKIGDYANTGLEGWTTKRGRDVVLESIRRDADGSIYVELTAALRAHSIRNPRFKFAVVDPETGGPLPGSSTGLASAFSKAPSVDVMTSMFHLTDDPNPTGRGHYRAVDTPFGRLKIIVYGSEFHWDDVLYQLYNYMSLTNFVAYLPLCTVMSVVALVVVRAGLAPLRSAAAKVGEIDVNSLHQRVSSAGLPLEILPFVDAVNSALHRVDEGVARQRRFTANAAHELRTPIAILRARVDKLHDNPLKLDIERDVRRIQGVVDQLLVLAQIKERNAAAAPVVNLGETVLMVAADFMPIVVARERHIELEPPPAPVFVHGYRWAIESIVTNLVENAVRAEPKGGTITVRVRPTAVIEVIDHGEGVASDDHEKLFEPFWRKSDKTSGTGLGLSIVRELVNEMGGNISVDTTSGGGATFRVAFEWVQGADAQPAPSNVSFDESSALRECRSKS